MAAVRYCFDGGWGQVEDKMKSKEAGFNFHMVKHVETATLGKLLDGLL
jgi:hypothetical protein